MLRSGKTQWGKKQQKVFEELKQYLQQMTTLVSPTLGTSLLLYIAASQSAVSGVLVKEKQTEGGLKQIPDYFVSEALSGSKLLYSEMEKLTYAVIVAKRKLCQYFKAHKIIVPTSLPIKDVIPRTVIKSHVLVDFVADWTPSEEQDLAPIPLEIWEIECD